VTFRYIGHLVEC